MNKIFKTKYCEKRQTYIATHEKTKTGVPATTSASNGLSFLKYNAIALAISALFAKSLLAQGLVNPSVVAGQATINAVNQNNTVIQQTTNKAVINWENFTIPKDNTVNFQQPNTSSITLNRVLGSQKSEIHGSLNATGQVWLLNPNGTLIGENGSINAHGFMATTHQISNDQFMNGSYSLRKNNGLSRDIQNLGVIDVAEGGYAILSADKVVNEGVIGARLGTVALASGEAITIDLVGDQLLSFQVDSTISDGSQKSVTNSGTISAHGGHVLLTAKAASNIVESVVNSTGVVEAVSVEKKNGKIVFTSGREGTTSVGGIVDVSGKNNEETAGSVEIFGKNIKVANAKIDATGSSGGGNVYVGGGWQGAKVGDHKPAKIVTVASDTSIDASAISEGDGGEVVIWSDVPDPSSVTRAHGVIKAEGGKQSGDGGKVETSGNALYTQNIQVSTRAKNGEYGLWLLDPTTITIGNGTNKHTFASGEYTYDDGDANGFIDGPTLNASLNGNNVGITADNITLAENYSDSYATTLTLNATSVITLTGSFNRSAGTIVANAGTTLTGAGGLACGAACTVSIGADSSTYTGVINTPNFTKQGSGTLTLSSSNTIGATAIAAGGIKVGHGSAFGQGAVSVQGGAFVDLNGNTVSNSFELQGIGPGGGGALRNTNTGTGSFINAGTITLKQIELRNGTDSTVEIGGAGDIFLGAPIANASGTSAGKLKKSGAGTIFLETGNSHTGGTEISAGALRAYHSGALGTTGDILFSGGTLSIHVNNFALDVARINNQNSVNIEVSQDSQNRGVNFALSGSSSFGGNIAIASGSTMALQPSSSMQYAGNISGAGALAITGSNATDRFAFGGNATHTGGTTVTNAVLQVGDGTGNTFNDHSGALALDANSTLEINPGTSGTITSNITSAGTIKNISSQDVTFSNVSAHTGPTSVASDGSITFDVASGRTLNLSGSITGGGQIVKTGTGQLELRGNNSFSGGLRLAAGNTKIYGSSPIPLAGTLQFGGSSVLFVEDVTTDYSGIMRFDSSSSYLRIHVPAGNSYTMASSITSQTGGILSKRGDGKLILGANFDFGGGAAIYGGDLVVGTGGTSGRLNLNNANFTFHNTGARYIYNRSAAVTKTHPFKVNNSSASGSIDNIGGGTLTLTGTIDAGITIPTSPTNGAIVSSSSSSSGSGSSSGGTNTTADFGNLSITGSFVEGQTITANYNITDANGHSAEAVKIDWYRVSDPSTAIASGTIASGGGTYVLTPADVGQTLVFEVTYTDNDGNPERSLVEQMRGVLIAGVAHNNESHSDSGSNTSNTDSSPPPDDSRFDVMPDSGVFDGNLENFDFNAGFVDINTLEFGEDFDTNQFFDFATPPISNIDHSLEENHEHPREYSTEEFFQAIGDVGLVGDELTDSFNYFVNDDPLNNDPFYDPSAYFIEAANFAANFEADDGVGFEEIAEFAGKVDRQVFQEATELAEKFEPEFFEVAKELAFLAGDGGSVTEVFDTAIDEAFDVVRQISNVPPPGDFGAPPGDFGPGPGDLGAPPPADLAGPEVIDVGGDPGVDLAVPPGDLGAPPPGDFGPGPGDIVDVGGGAGPGEFLAPAPTDFAPPVPGDFAALPGDFAPPPGLDLGDIGEFGAEAASFGDFTEFGDVGAPPPGDIGGPPTGELGPGPGPGGDLGAPPPGDVVDGGPPPADGPPLADGADAPPPGDEPAPGELADGPAGDDGPPPGDEPAPESAEAPGDDGGPGEEAAPESADAAGEPATEVAADGPPPGDGPPAGDTAPAGDAVAAGDTPPPAGTPPADAPEAPAPTAAPAPVTADAAPPPPPPVEPPPPSPVPTQKAPTPVDSADAGDKTLAAVAPPSPPKPASQPQAVSVKTVSVVPGGVVNVQVPVPPRPPAGLAGTPKIPSVGNSSNW